MAKESLIDKIFGQNDGWIVAKKFFVNALIVVLSGLVVVWQDDPRFLVVIPVVQAILNMIKHY